ncbi:NAD(P)-binding protein [bacterium]|nr:NAD(P)-binding protein [bacterium]
MKVAVIGSGLAGLTAAWLLSREYEVHLFEASPTIGGLCQTVDATVEGKSFPVDIGFMLYNDKNYGNLCNLLRQLGVEGHTAQLGFSLHEDGADIPFEYANKNLDSMFAQRWRLLDAQHWRMLLDIMKFNRFVTRMLAGGIQPGVPLADFLKQSRVSKRLVERYLLPMGGALFATSMVDMLAFPAASFLRHLQQHGLLYGAEPREWRSIKGGSQALLQKLIEPFKERIYVNESVTSLERLELGVNIKTSLDKEEHFNHAVIACHPDKSLKFLKLLSAEEHALLSCFNHHVNRAVLHTDTALMPQNQACWTSHNVMSFTGDSHRSGQQIPLTYWLNVIQSLPVEKPVLLSLNPTIEPDKEKTLGEYALPTPQLNTNASKAQTRIKTIQGKGGFWYCGAYQMCGTAEDAVYSAIRVAKDLGVTIPWDIT